MTKAIPILFVLCLCISSAYPQKAPEPQLVGTWTLGNDDYQKLISRSVERFTGSYLKENPHARMIARLCSKDKISVALAASYGFAYQLPRFAKHFNAPTEKFFFAVWSKCPARSEEYWFVPENSKLEFDEIIGADKVEVNRWLAASIKNSPQAEAEFANYLKEFIAELKKNPSTEGFIIRNIRMNDRKLQDALAQIQNEKIDAIRIQTVSKMVYDNYYPEFLTVRIKE